MPPIQIILKSVGMVELLVSPQPAHLLYFYNYIEEAFADYAVGKLKNCF